MPVIPRGALLAPAALILSFASIAFAQQAAKPLTTEEAKKLKNPVPYTKKSIAQGRSTFLRYCAGCHGNDGKATVDVIADATDLTSPKSYRDGNSDGEIFRSIRDGQGASMPAFKPQIHDEADLWNLVNFIHSLWPESMRPPLKDDQSAAGKTK